MIRRFQSHRIILPDSLYSGYVYVQDGKILAVTRQELPFDEEFSLGELYLAPGLIDLHVHGGVGIDFGSCTAQQAKKAVAFHRSHGTTTLLPTLASAPLHELGSAIDRLRSLFGSNVPGVHLEGPYFSKAQCGAQNTDFITPPISEDYLPFLKAYAPMIARWSYAPELDDGSFCKALVQRGILVSAGHTDALGQQLQNAVRHGCKLTTHLFSCTSTITREGGYRRTGVLEETLRNDDIYAEIIADGCHLPSELIELTVKVKGRNRVALISDALSAAGQNIRQGTLNGVPFIVEDGVCRLSDRSAFCGSIATGDRLIRTAMQSGFSVVDSIYMAAATPADLLRIPKGRILEGNDADLIAFDDNVAIHNIFIGGQPI